MDKIQKEHGLNDFRILKYCALAIPTIFDISPIYVVKTEVFDRLFPILSAEQKYSVLDLQDILQRLDTRHIFVDVGLGFLVEFTWPEAPEFISLKEARLAKDVLLFLFIYLSRFYRFGGALIIQQMEVDGNSRVFVTARIAY
ncbi:hypothetical protein MKW98_019568 [Papaver atlanticum]|uniref:Uncharacterized protein n=1 Tax=Papaver atlanticum TaxID=357466 RepID=A0AAD4SAA2_9MAGN|nr:hypothetical protein MKW98_019568 [Papaver atlanticum]